VSESVEESRLPLRHRVALCPGPRRSGGESTSSILLRWLRSRTPRRGGKSFAPRLGLVSRTQLNAALSSRGRDPISDRTFGHYHKLLRLGYTEYVSINRLDIRHANDSVFDLADRSRYLDRAISNPGRVLIPRGTLLLTLEGTIGKVSEGFATLRVTKTEEKQSMQLDNLKKAVELAPLLEALNPSILQVLGVEIPPPDSYTLRRLEALKDQAVEAAVELQASSTEPIALTAADPTDRIAEG
jgi:hypothetical protein